jgi:uncharacterized protein
MLRGPQTLGELKSRSERLHMFESVGDVEETLAGLAERELVERQARRPGQKEERWAQLLGSDAEPSAEAPAPPTDSLEARVERLEEQVAELRSLLVQARSSESQRSSGDSWRGS